MYNNHMLVVGLTGNYGMGKSAVLSMFRELGAITIDADWIVSLLLKEKNVLAKIKSLLGKGVSDKNGFLDKKKVSEKIFKNKKLRLQLEDILHPLVFEKTDNFIKKYKDSRRLCIVEAPLIFERGYEDRFDRMITVFTDQATAIKRLGMLGITVKQARERLKCQLPIKKKIKKSDFSIDNSNGIGKTEKQVRVIFEKLLQEAEVKELVSEGKVNKASKILGKPFYIEGKVIKGAGRGGKLLHTPTANIIPSQGYIPKEGVYAVKIAVADIETRRREDTGRRKITDSPIHRFAHSPIFDGVANIGKNPTFGGANLCCEAHIFGFSGNLLGKTIKIHFIDRIRNEKKFPNAKALETQINKDIKKAKEILKSAKEQ